MKPKEKADELYWKYYQLVADSGYPENLAKECALIAVDELIYETQFEVPNVRQKYWQQVKKELELL
jgi:hypothetical protein